MLYKQNNPIKTLHFIESGIISVVTPFDDGVLVECGLVGKEGMIGMQLLSGIDRLTQDYYVQAPAQALEISLSLFNKVVSADNQLRRLILQFGFTLTAQSMQLAACNAHHALKQRLCRWLLMWGDRLETRNLHITQEFLSIMLGVRRASVSEVLHPLKEMGIIDYSRGKIDLVNMEALNSLSCECYSVLSNDYNRVFSGSAAK